MKQIRRKGPWLSLPKITDRYTLSEPTVRRLIQLGLWPDGLKPTAGRRVWDQGACDEAFAALLVRGEMGRAVSTAAKAKAKTPTTPEAA